MSPPRSILTNSIPFAARGVLGYKHVFRMPVSAECEDWRMLHEQKMFLRVFAVFVV